MAASASRISINFGPVIASRRTQFKPRRWSQNDRIMKQAVAMMIAKLIKNKIRFMA
jgi:hypothetical protein